MAVILIIEDDAPLLRSIKTYLEDSGHKVLTAMNGVDGLKQIENHSLDLVFTDLCMPVMDGFGVVEAVTSRRPDLPVIVISGVGKIQDAVRAIRAGAWNYLEKPIHDLRTLEHQIRMALETTALRREATGLADKLLTPSENTASAFNRFTTISPKMQAIFRYLEVVAPTSQPILIQGETGTGKELLAHTIHALSGRKGDFAAVNLAGLDDQMFADTLFGHLRGAYTGADSIREGLVARTAEGTLLLDEIGDLAESSQIKLLRLLQEGEYYPLGSDRPRTSKARFLMATHRDLRQLAEQGRFRRDLYYRLCSHTVTLPPLSDRLEDLPYLLDLFIAEAEQTLNRRAPGLRRSLLTTLADHPFPGNIRELKAIVTDAVARYDQNGRADLATILESVPDEKSLAPSIDTDAPLPTLQQAEMLLIRQAMQRASGNQGKAAQILGLSRTALNKRLAKLLVDTP